jgi:hypothetical protein
MLFAQSWPWIPVATGACLVDPCGGERKEIGEGVRSSLRDPVKDESSTRQLVQQIRDGAMTNTDAGPNPGAETRSLEGHSTVKYPGYSRIVRASGAANEPTKHGCTPT